MTKYCPTCSDQYPDDEFVCRTHGMILVADPPHQPGPVGGEAETETEDIPRSPAQRPAQLVVAMLGVSVPVEAGPGVLIGRQPESSRFAHALEQAGFTNVGRIHCHLKLVEGVVQVTDLGSTNGTFVNDLRIDANTPQQLGPGDRLRLAANREVELRWN